MILGVSGCVGRFAYYDVRYLAVESEGAWFDASAVIDSRYASSRCAGSEYDAERFFYVDDRRECDFYARIMEPMWWSVARYRFCAGYSSRVGG